MKICLANNLYKPYARGGAETVASVMVKELRRRGHAVAVAATRPLFFGRKKVAEEAGNYYLPSFFFHLARLPLAIRLAWHLLDMFDPVNFFRLFVYFKREKFDLVITHNLKGLGFLAPLAICLSGARHIHIIHDIQLIHPSGLMFFGREKTIDSWPARIYQAANIFLFKPVSAVVSPSAWLLELHRDRGFFKDSRLLQIANPVSLEADPGKSERPFRRRFRFFYVGLLEKHKGVGRLVRAFKKISTMAEAELVVAGGGSLLSDLRKEAAGCGNIRILGRIENETVRRLMGESDCLVVPSLCYENSPAVIYEAFAAGLPAIGSKLGGIAELIGDDALLFAPKEDDIGRKMRFVMENRASLEKNRERNAELAESSSPSGYIDMILNL